jgi:uncharacterized protein YceH (UPF0502 family)
VAWTQTDIDALRAAIASGQLMVRSSDRMVTYRSLAEMQQTLRMMEGQVGGSTGLRLGRDRDKAAFRRD